MTKKELKAAVLEVVEKHKPLAEIEILLDKCLESNALNIEGIPPGSYLQPRLIYYAILHTMAIKWRPQVSKSLREANNLITFIL